MRFRAILGRSFEAVKQVSGTVIHFLVVGPSLLVVKSFPELGHYGIVAGKVPTHPGSTRLLYACVEVWRALISRRLGFGDMAGQIVI